MISISMISPFSTSAIGPPTAASGETCPMAAPRVAPEKRPSVIRCDGAAESSSHDCGGRVEHFSHAGAALRAFIPDDDHIAVYDVSAVDGVHGVLFTVVHLSGAGMLEHFRRNRASLYHTGVRRQIAAGELRCRRFWNMGFPQDG